jgi:flagellar basal-body rod protein FlgG
MSETAVDTTGGAVRATGRALDVAIVGGGFIVVELPNEQTGYSRVGALQVNIDGQLCLPTGQILKNDIRIPAEARNVEVLPDGRVLGIMAGETEPTELGQIELALFGNPEALDYRGEGIFTAPADSQLRYARPGEDGAAALAVRSLEGANVRMTDEMVSMLLMQRAYELNSRVVQVADELMSITNNLRRS